MLGIHSFGDVYSCADLVYASKRFVYNHFVDVARNDEFLQITHAHLTELLKSDQLQVSSEEQVFLALYRWVEFNPEQRTQFVCDLLHHIRLPLLDSEFLENKVLAVEYIKTCAQCQKLVACAIRLKADKFALSSVLPRSAPQGIFVVGGRNSLDCQLRSMERYDFVSNEWIPMVKQKSDQFNRGVYAFLC